MTQETKNPFFAGSNSEAQFESLEPGSYNAVCIGVTVRELPSYNDKNVMEDKVQFIFAVYDGGEKYYLRTKPMKLVISDKSNLFLTIASWTKASLERVKEGFSCDKMVGFGAQLVVMTHDYNDRVYPDIANILPLKKGVKVAVVPDEIPEFLARGVKAQVWAEGITVKAPDVKAKEPAAQPFGTVTPQPAPAPAVPPQEQAPQVDDDGDELPF